MSAKRKLPVAITIEDSFKPNLEQLPAIDDIASIKLTPVGKDDAEPGTPKVQMLVCRLRLSPNHHTCMYQVVCGVADVANSDGKRPDVIENKPGKAGSVRVYKYLLDLYGPFLLSELHITERNACS